MSHDERETPAVRPKDPNDDTSASPASDQDLILKAVMMVLSETSLTRFELLITRDQDPSEAAATVISGLSSYDFLSGLMGSGAHYDELKKNIERDIGNAAERVIREQNPR